MFLTNVFDKSWEPAVTVSVMVTVSLSVTVTVHDMSCQMLKLILGIMFMLKSDIP